MLAHKLRRASGSGGGAANTLTQKGYGRVKGSSSTANVSLGYGTVLAGSAPAAGDLVVWMVWGIDTGGQPIDDLTGSGWTQAFATVATSRYSSILAKVVVAGDISGPPVGITAPSSGGHAAWVAYTVDGTISNLSITGLATTYSAFGVPTSIAIDSSAITGPDVAISCSLGTGTTSPITLAWSGATPDITFAEDTIFTGVVDIIEFMFGEDVGGVNLTTSKGDDNQRNSLSAGYVTVQF